MKVLFDTSSLVGALVESHPSHERCFSWYERGRRGEISAFVCSHSLAELYSVLSTYPVGPRPSVEGVGEVLGEALSRPFQFIPLTAADYRAVVESQIRLGIPGGSVYDGLIARAAEKASADVLLTLNRADFERVWPDHRERIRVP